jgi:hypothetical protein
MVPRGRNKRATTDEDDANDLVTTGSNVRVTGAMTLT